MPRAYAAIKKHIFKVYLQHKDLMPLFYIYIFIFLFACTKNYSARDSSTVTPTKKSTPVPGLADEMCQQKFGRGINDCDDQGRTPLLEAIEKKDLETVKALLEAPEHNLQAVEGDALRQATIGKNLEIFKFLLESRANVNAIDKQKNTPLCNAFGFDNHAATQQLLNAHDIDVNKAGSEGDTLLHCVATRKDKKVLNLLLGKKDIDLNVKNNKQKTALHKALKRSYGPNPEFTKMLVDAGADVNIKNRKGNTALYMAVEQAGSIYSDSLQIAHTLLDAKTGINVNVQNNRGKTVLHAALLARYPSLDIVNKLLDAGADLSIQCDSYGTVLHAALWRYIDGSANIDQKMGINLAFLQALLSKERGKNKAFVNIQNKQGNTALHTLLATLCSASATQLLIDAGVNVNAQNKDGNTALHTLLADSRSASVTQLLLDAGVNVNAQNKDGNTALHLFLRSLHPSRIIVEMLLKAGARLDIRDHRGETGSDIIKNCGIFLKRAGITRENFNL